MELIKNSRFRTGSQVDIFHSPVYEGNSVGINETTGQGAFNIEVEMSTDMAIEQVSVGDICSFGFGAGQIFDINSEFISINFPYTMFPSGSDITAYIGSVVQHVLIFSAARVIEGFAVSKYLELVEQATYGYVKAVYNLQTKADLELVPLSFVDDGTIDKLMYSKGFVLRSCNQTDEAPTAGDWEQDFPLELSGTSIDPIYRRAFMLKREITSTSRRAKAKMSFRLIG